MLQHTEQYIPISPLGTGEKIASKIIFEATHDIKYLQQYFFLREYTYRLDLGLKNFSGQEDEFDSESTIITGRLGEFVFCGGRLTFSDSVIGRQPLEYKGFRLAKAIPALSDVLWCELTRLAILPQYRKQGHLLHLFDKAADIARSKGAQYMVGASPMKGCEHFKQEYQKLGYEGKILTDLKPPIAPIHEHLDLHFIIVNIGEKHAPVTV